MPNRVVKKGNGSKPSRPRPDAMARNVKIEKNRQEALDEDFLNLARLVPGLAHVRRLSKDLIVNESVQHLREQREMCIAAARGMEDLLADNRQLISEVNALRSQMGVTGVLPAKPRPVTEPMVKLMGVKDEVCGTFPAGFGDNWAYNLAQSGPVEGDGIGIHFPDEEVGLSLDDDIFSAPGPQSELQPPVPGELVIPYGDLPGVISASDERALNPSDFDSWLGNHNQSGPPLSFQYNLYATTAAPCETYVPIQAPDCFSGPFGAESVDPFQPSWTQEIESLPDGYFIQHGYAVTGELI